jgi:hypothetical protein
MLALEQRLELKAQRQLDGFAGSPGGRDYNDPTGRRFGREKCLRIGREEVIAGNAHAGR